MTKFGGEFIVGGIAFAVSHKAYLEVQYVLDQGVVFMFSGTTVSGETRDAWVDSDLVNVEFGKFVPDPGVPSLLSEFDREVLYNAVHDDRLRDGRHLHAIDNGGGLDFAGW